MRSRLNYPAAGLAVPITGLLLAQLVSACGSDDAATSNTDSLGRSGDLNQSTNNGSVAAAGGSNANAMDPGAEPPLPPEKEVMVDFELPHAGERYVYVANPDSDTVAVLDAETLAIHVVEAGDEPTFLQTLAGRDAAVVLNTRSADASIIRTESGKSTVSNVDVLPGSNAIAVSPDGRHAVAYFNTNFSAAGSGTGSFQDVSVITLSEDGDTATGMTIGFEPSAVFFSEDGENAFVVTKSGVSILNYAKIEKEGSHIARTVPFADAANAETLDVSVTADGKYALARRTGEGTLRLVDLQTEEITQLNLGQAVHDATTTEVMDAGAAADAGDGGPMPAEPSLPENLVVTDVDLSPSGDFAMAVVREASAVLQVPIPGAFLNGEDIKVTQVADELVGSVTVSPDEHYALLYTTAVDDNERMTVLDLMTDTTESVDLRKAITGVTISPDSRTALVVHKKLAGDPNELGLSSDQIIDRSFGYSLIQLDTAFTKLQVTPTQLGPFALVPDGSYLFILFNDEPTNRREVHRVGLNNFLVDPIPLGSPPVSVGAVPASKKVFVGQEHPDGRITFIDWETAEPESITGFELNSRIRE